MQTNRSPIAADLHHRFGAFIIDWHIRTIPLALWGFWVFFLWFPGFQETVRNGTVGFASAWQLLASIIERGDVASIGWLCLLAYLLYHPVFELAMHGDSPGKRMMNITVRTLADDPPGKRQIILRNLWRAVEFLPIAYLLGVVMIVRSADNARIGDARTHTRVVMQRDPHRR